MGRTCVIHIGLPKTGTTTIQRSLMGYSDSDWYYADLDGDSNHSFALFRAGYDVPTAKAADASFKEDGWQDPRRILFYKRYIKPALEDVTISQSYREALQREVERCGNRSMILSAEALASRYSPAEVLRDLLANSFDNFKVISYLRPTHEFIPSSFAQLLRNTDYEGFSAVGNMDFHRIFRLDYRRRVIKWIHACGEENFEGVILDRGRCVLRDFCQRIGLDPDPIRVYRRNQSFTLEAVAVLCVISRLCKLDANDGPFSAKKSVLNLVLSDFGYRRFVLDRATCYTLENQFRADLEWVDGFFSGTISQKHTSDGNSVALGAISEILDFADSIMSEIIELIQNNWDPTISSKIKTVGELANALNDTWSSDHMNWLKKIPGDFDPAGYLAMNSDVADAGLDPYAHFWSHGIAESRDY